MDSTYTKRLSYISLVIISLGVGFLFLIKDYLDLVINMCESGNFNFSNISFFAVRLIESVVLPAIFIIPWNFEFGRVRVARISFIAYGVVQLLTLTWIFYFLGSDHIGCSNQVINVFQTDTLTEIWANKYLWDTTGWISVLFTVLSGGMAIYTGINFDDDRVKVRNCLFIIFAMKVIFPFISSILSGRGFYSLTWIVNNYISIIVCFLLFSAIYIVSLSDMTWVECIWEQDAIDPDVMDEEFTQEGSKE